MITFVFNDGGAFISCGRNLLTQDRILLALAEALRKKISTSVYFTSILVVKTQRDNVTSGYPNYHLPPTRNR